MTSSGRPKQNVKKLILVALAAICFSVFPSFPNANAGDDVSSPSDNPYLAEFAAGYEFGYRLGTCQDYITRIEQFLESDATHTHKYDAQNFNCMNFSQGVVEDATKADFSARMVEIDYHDVLSPNGTIAKMSPAHMVVAFDLPNGQMIFYEPQNNTRITDIWQYAGIPHASTIRAITIGQAGDTTPPGNLLW